MTESFKNQHEKLRQTENDLKKDLRKKVLKFMKENAPKVTVDGKSKYDAKKMGEILRQLKAKGVFKQGGRLDKQRIQRYKEFIKK